MLKSDIIFDLNSSLITHATTVELNGNKQTSKRIARSNEILLSNHSIHIKRKCKVNFVLCCLVARS